MSNQALVPAVQYLQARNKDLMAIAPFIEGQDEVRRRYIWRQIIAVNQIIKNDSSLQSAKPETTYGAFAEGIMLGLEFGALAEAHLIAFGGETKLMIGYSGLRRLAKQANKQIVDIETHLVFEDDKFEYRLGLEKDLTHTPNRQGKQDKNTVSACYTVIHLLLSDSRIYKHWSVIEPRYWKPIQKKSHSSAWSHETDQLEMIRKTSLRYTLKDMEKSPMLAQAEQFNYATETGADVVYDADFVDKTPARPPAAESTTGKASAILGAQTSESDKRELIHGYAERLGKAVFKTILDKTKCDDIESVPPKALDKAIADCEAMLLEKKK